MTYSFACPVPCDHEIKVHAKNNDDAVNAIIRAGAIRCRNMRKIAIVKRPISTAAGASGTVEKDCAIMHERRI